MVLPSCTTIVPAVLVIGSANTCTAWSQVIADAVMVRMSQGREQVRGNVFYDIASIEIN